ncbi:hypothetical protein CJ030_MR2G004219 [Morella rubra]|uniref:Retrotransposon Copia-like N-terminal domain-containing protein n=1 Tax=Morella rubra TaxID=262757 RepID=A0A6A1WNF9_9ROSI|nr:hypothetical protein CJ030_MR2G004219 [Morella rubra]
MTEGAESGAESTLPQASDHPFRLAASDNLGQILVNQPLTYRNYNTWRRAMVMALQAKKKLEFVNGDVKEPSSTKDSYDSWLACNNMVQSWIVQCLSPDIACSVMYISSAKDLWTELEEHFSQGNRNKISELQHEIGLLVQESDDVPTYFTKLKIMWEELASFRPIPTCTCTPACSCNALKTVASYLHEDYVVKFLNGLNTSLSHVKDHILLMDPLPAINKVFFMAHQDEKKSSTQSSAVIPFAKSTALLSRNSGCSQTSAS